MPVPCRTLCRSSDRGNTQSFTTKGSCATLVANLGAVCITDPIWNSSVYVGNSSSGQSAGGGDWIGPSHTGGCPECFVNGSTQYLIPTQALSYILSSSYRSYAAAAYLVDGGMPVQVDAYAANVCNLSGDIVTVGASSQIQNVAPAALKMGAAISGTGIPAGTTISAPPGSTLTLSNPVNPALVTQATVETLSVSLNLSILGTLTTGSSTITGLLSTAQLVIGDAVSGTGILTGTTITGITPATVTISTKATATGSQSLTFYGGNAMITGTVSPSSNSVTGRRLFLYAVGWAVGDRLEQHPGGHDDYRDLGDDFDALLRRDGPDGDADCHAR